jgi:hypothetical protein
MNLPDHLSTAANRVFSLLSASQSPQSMVQLSEAYAQQPATEERHKAIATVESLIVKGIVSREGNSAEPTYILSKTASEVGPDERADAEDDYAQKTDANAEEQRMIALLEQNDEKLPESKLFDLYEKEQLPTETGSPTDGAAIEKALKELTDAGLVVTEGDTYSIKQ